MVAVTFGGLALAASAFNRMDLASLEAKSPVGSGAFLSFFLIFISLSLPLSGRRHDIAYSSAESAVKRQTNESKP